MTQESQEKNTGRFVFAAAFLAVLTPLGSRALWDPDEGRYAEIAREMLALKDWIVPHLNYLPYLEKPPLGPWMISGFLALFGQSEWAARLPCALAGLATAMIVWRMSHKVSRPRAAWLSAAVLLSSFEFYLFTQFLVLDMIFTLFLTAALWLFWEGYGDQKDRNLLWALAGTASGLATLTKGPAGLVLPGLVVFLFLASGKKLSLLRNPGALTGIFTAVLIPIPWLVLMERRIPGFIRFFLVREQAGRFLTQIHGRVGSVFFYVPVVLIGFAPWSFLIPLWIKNLWNRKRQAAVFQPVVRFLLIWMGTIFIFFSLAGSKLITYALPIFPPLALLAGDFLGREPAAWSKRSLLSGLFITNGLIATSMIGLASIHFHPILQPLLASFPLSITVLALSPLAVGWFLGQERRLEALAALAAGGLLFGASALLPARSVEPFFSTRPLAVKILREIKPGDAVVSFDANAQESLSSAAGEANDGTTWKDFWANLSLPFLQDAGMGIAGFWQAPPAHSFAPTYDRRLQSLAYYLQRRVIVVGALGELLPGARLDPNPEFLMNEEGFSQLLRSRTVFGLCRTIHLDEARKCGLLGTRSTQADLTLFSNKPKE